MKPKSFAGMSCSVAGALEIIGDRWTLLLLRDLGFGLSRFDAFQDSTGISNATLAQRLRGLEENGIVTRSRYQDRPPRYQYFFTAKGRDLWKVTAALREWGDKWDVAGLGAPPVEVVDRATKRALLLALVDPETGLTVPRERVEIRPGPAATDQVIARIDHAAKAAAG